MKQENTNMSYNTLQCKKGEKLLLITAIKLGSIRVFDNFKKRRFRPRISTDCTRTSFSSLIIFARTRVTQLRVRLLRERDVNSGRRQPSWLKAINFKATSECLSDEQAGSAASAGGRGRVGQESMKRVNR